MLHLHQRRFRRIYLSTNPSPHDPQNLLLAQANRPMKTAGMFYNTLPNGIASYVPMIIVQGTDSYEHTSDSSQRKFATGSSYM